MCSDNALVSIHVFIIYHSPDNYPGFLYCQIAARLGVANNDVRKVIIWGNHSSTQFPDVRHALVKMGGKELPVSEAMKDDNYIKNDFVSVS